MKLIGAQNKDKLRGGYYTPTPIVEFMVEWLTNDKNIKKILEPSAGDGQFVKALANSSKELDINAVEILEEESTKISLIKSKKSNISIFNNDFYDFYEAFIQDKNDLYDAVIGNPPYIRYQYLTNEQREFQSDILKNNGLKPNKLINAWVAFTIASIEMIKEGGKFAFVLPTDLLQVSYSKQLRAFLLNSLSNITIITFNELVFKGIQQDVVLILGTKSSYLQLENQNTGLKIINIDNMSNLTKEILDKPFTSVRSYSTDKWTKFYLNDNERNYFDDVFKRKMINLEKIAKVEVGITTGNNSFFVVNDEVRTKYDLSSYTIPVLGRSVEIFGNSYTFQDLRKNINEGRNTWLLNFNNYELNKNAKGYIKYGERNEQNIGYKLSLRKRWYDVPSVWIPDAFMLRRIGRIPRLVLNENGATSTDTFHRVKFKDKKDRFLTTLLFYSSASLLTLELEGRVFGGGALEILPGDIKNVLIPKISKDLSFEKVKDLERKLDYRIRNQDEWESIIKWVDNIVVKYSNFDENEMELIYSMWKKINDKRTKTID